MKKKIFLVLAVMAMLVCVFAISVSAATVYKTENGDTLFSYTDENNDYIFDSYEGSFPKTDSEDNPLTWYIASTATENGDTVHTVKCLKTLGEAGNINKNGEYTFTSPVTNKNTVSVNYPDNAGIKKAPAFGAYDTRNQNNILFAYMPNTLTELPESLFQETPVIIGEIDDETPVTKVPYKLCHEARNIKVVNIPASVTFIDSDGERNGAPFCNTKSLITVTFAKNSQLSRICPYAFVGSGIQEIQFPSSLEYVNQNLFRNCTSLRVIRFGANFKGFENVSRDGSVSTAHHSLTHTVTGLKEIYLPASFYATKPNVNYKVSYAFDGGYDVKYFYTGTEEQLIQAKKNFINSEWTTSGSENNYKFLNATVISWEKYSLDKSAYEKGNYVIYGYNVCDAFYNGKHVEDNNPCVINCDRCKSNGVAEENPIHNIGTTITYVSFDTAGIKTIGCTNAGCTHKTTEELQPLFTCLGYSASEGTMGGGIALGFKVNSEAITEYEKLTGKTVAYGVFAVSQSKLGANNIFGENGEMTKGVLGSEIKTSHTVFEIKITNIPEDKADVKLALGAYVAVTDGEATEYSYMQPGTPDENEKYCFVSYNDVVGTPSTNEDTAQ